jgi:hypothetical protein
MAIDATIGGTSSDSYISVAGADAYHDDHLYAADWTGADTATKEKALKMATRIVDERVDWNGLKHTDAQSLRWPRSNVVDQDGYTVLTTVIPAGITNAIAEFAKQLIVSDSTAASEAKGIRFLQADKIKLSLDRSDRADVLPEIVLEMLQGWGSISTRSGFGSAKLVRA